MSKDETTVNCAVFVHWLGVNFQSCMRLYEYTCMLGINCCSTMVLLCSRQCFPVRHEMGQFTVVFPSRYLESAGLCQCGSHVVTAAAASKVSTSYGTPQKHLRQAPDWRLVIVVVPWFHFVEFCMRLVGTPLCI